MQKWLYYNRTSRGYFFLRLQPASHMSVSFNARFVESLSLHSDLYRYTFVYIFWRVQIGLWRSLSPLRLNRQRMSSQLPATGIFFFFFFLPVVEHCCSDLEGTAVLFGYNFPPLLSFYWAPCTLRNGCSVHCSCFFAGCLLSPAMIDRMFTVIGFTI